MIRRKDVYEYKWELHKGGTMKEKERKTLSDTFRRMSTAALALALMLSFISVPVVRAEDDPTQTTDTTDQPSAQAATSAITTSCTITYTDGNWTVTDTIPECGEGTAYGELEKAQVRRNYYKDGVEYDLVSPADTEGTFDSSLALTVTYGPHAAANSKAVFTYLYGETEIKKDVVDITPAMTGGNAYVYTPVATVNAGGVDYVVIDTTAVTIDYDTTTQMEYTFRCTLNGDEKADIETLTIHFVDEAGAAISGMADKVVNTRNNYVYFAAMIKQIDIGGETVTYVLTDASNRFEHTHGKGNEETTFHYKKLDGAQSYEWTVVLMNGVTNNVMDTLKRTIEPGKSATVTESDLPGYDGLKIASSTGGFSKTHSYGDTELVSYVYYVPTDYEYGKDTKEVTVEYRNIANKKVIKSEKVTLNSLQDVVYPTDGSSFDKITVDGINYLPIKGQLDHFTMNYFSPKTTFTVWYYDENNTEWEHMVITRVIDYGTTVVEGETTYTVIPGGAAINVAPAGGGAGQQIAVEDATGQITIPEDNTPGVGGGTTINVGGTEIETDITPGEGNENDGIFANANPMLIGGAAAVGVGILGLLLFLLLGKKKDDEEEA